MNLFSYNSAMLSLYKGAPLFWAAVPSVSRSQLQRELAVVAAAIAR
jgi:hypothetical protein